MVANCVLRRRCRVVVKTKFATIKPDELLSKIILSTIIPLLYTGPSLSFTVYRGSLFNIFHQKQPLAGNVWPDLQHSHLLYHPKSRPLPVVIRHLDRMTRTLASLSGLKLMKTLLNKDFFY